MQSFLDMGKYAAFVWPAFGVSAAGMIAAVLLTLRTYYRARARLLAIERIAK
ncbi:MAG: heme exporter protein CcmD [Rhizomicrobium sp.]|jgi:heme exporter protein CcmD